MTEPTDNREFAVVVWGATGFTGALVTEYLLQKYGVTSEFKWAIAGRNQSKLDALKATLGAPELDTIVADSFAADSLARMAGRTRVVLTTVGPYAHYGTALVAACAELGTDYCDLAGEVPWIRRMIDAHEASAAVSGARLVNCCGFDSVPSDVGVWFLQETARRRTGAYCRSVTTFVRALKGAMSGGTVASMMNVVREARADRGVARLLSNPYALNPDPAFAGPDVKDQHGPRLDGAADTWTAPFIMAGINTRIVRRSNALLNFRYGRNFRYAEAIMTGNGPGGWLRAAAISTGIGFLVLAGSFDASRLLVERKLLPKPGEGPDAGAREAGFFRLRQIGQLADGTTLETQVTGDRDPGYGSTSKMISECAVALAHGEASVPGGFWTPAAALGRPLVRRLTEHAGLTFTASDQ